MIKNSSWILFSGESHSSLDYLRFIKDIEFAAKMLISSGINPNNIHCFIDFISGAEKDLYINEQKCNIYQASTFKEKINYIKSDNLFFASTAHGNYSGICGTVNITPKELLDALKKVTTNNLVVIVTQCYAGVFNYLDVYGTPNCVVIGSTGLHTSLSFFIPEIEVDWQANLFWGYFFHWINNPISIDGDENIFSLNDLFKSSALKTNSRLNDLKSELSKQFNDWCIGGIKEIKKISRQIEKENNNDKKKNKEIERSNKENQVDKLSSIYHNHQEPWILNANLARKLILINK